MRVNKAGQRSIKLHDEDCIVYVEMLAETLDCPLYEAVEKIIFDRFNSELHAEVENLNVVNAEEHGVEYTYIHIPLESIYLQEMIDTFLVNYNTVGIQKTSDCYILRLERKENK